MTPQQFEDLKRNWYNDPCYDIEGIDDLTEEQRKEAVEYSARMHAEWNAKYTAKVQAVADNYECSYKTAEFIRQLLQELKDIREEVAIWKGYRVHNNID